MPVEAFVQTKRRIQSSIAVSNEAAKPTREGESPPSDSAGEDVKQAAGLPHHTILLTNPTSNPTRVGT
jgi:hypothetical protein